MDTVNLKTIQKSSAEPPIPGCPIIPQMNPIDTAGTISDMASGLKITECSTAKSSSEFNSSSSGLFSSSSSSMKSNSSSTVGCEPIALLNQVYQNAQNNIKCIISKATSSLNVTSIAINSIVINGTTLNCDVLNISQGVSQSIATSVSLTTDDKKMISSEVKNVAAAAADVVKNVQVSTPGTTDGVGARTASNYQTMIENTNYDQQVSTAIASLDLGVTSGNTLIFGPGTVINASACNFSQNIQVTIVASTVLSNSLGNTLPQAAAAIEAILNANPTPVGSTPNASTPAAAPASADAGSNTAKMPWYYVLIILGAIVLIGGIVYLKNKSRPTQTRKSKFKSGNI